MKKVFLFILLIGLIFTSVNALTINVSNVGNNFIEWEWDVSPVQNVSIDGVYVCDLDKNAQHLTLSDIGEEEVHTIIVYEDFNTTATNTTMTTKSNTAKIIDWTYAYWFFIIAIACCFIGIFVPFVGFLGAGFACIGVITTIQDSFWTGFVFLVIVCAGLFVGFAKSSGE